MKNPIIQRIHELGQSVWLDNLSRKMIQDHSLRKLIEEVGIYGQTSNPAIFQKAISDSNVYDEAIRACNQEGLEDKAVYERLAVSDIQQAADLFRDLYEQTDKVDGYVSLEVAPDLVHDTQGTIEEARRLWKWLDRPNVMIKVPGTEAGIPAITQLISEGININVTLLFSVERYRAVAEAYIKGLQMRHANNQPISSVASVASFFLSRIDVLVDEKLEEIAQNQPEKADQARALLGKVAVVNAKAAYQVYEEIIATNTHQSLVEAGAKPQRLLWASTSTKNPDYDELMYVHPLIGFDTVNTMPQNTLDTLLDKGTPQATLKDDMDQIPEVMQSLETLGIDIDQVAQQLEDEGIEKFVKPFNQLLEAISKEREAV